ncbi:MAG: hypothetical protein JRN34_00475 [Nitrososphaerota archaeon]|nr:hypothetical protein [Nitrososphaerota archaeon]MDG6943120.1 hypothetical protein [Nitrososphaerota archaeon]MDG6951002.1 hypothetical protein [Nitrososphaerota archaeon]
MSVLASVLKADRSRAPGPVPTYTSAHVLLVLLTIGDSGAIGRQALSTEAGLGEGAIRTVIKWLRADEYITVNASGCRLTPKGKHAYAELKRLIPKTLVLPRTTLTVGEVQVAALIKGKSDQVRSGIEQRDSAIKAGASGATTYLFRRSRFEVPGSPGDAEKLFPTEAWKKLKTGLEPEEGDVVIVCGSGEKHVSLIGVLSAALTLLG